MKRFKLGIITDEVSQDIVEVIEFARLHGLEAIEIRSVYNKGVHQLSNAEIDEIGHLAEQNGLIVSGIAGPLFKCDLDNPDEIVEHLKMAERLIEVAVRLQTQIIRGFSFWAKGTFRDALPEITNQLGKLAPLLESAGVILALEFDPSVYATNAGKTSAILNTLKSPNIRALYDPGNDLWDPDGEIPYPDGYELINEHICHVHLKDALRSSDGVKAVAIGTGEVDYRGIFARLDQDGYDGFLIIETHYRMKTQLTEEQLKRPAGNVFSEGGREASAHCMEHLSRLLHEMGLDEIGN
ncbi:sugar phosphate isomerase/epimerase family protein [Paenibacillus sp. GP183]|uniref:sugar phosphate isomerase/epimerase family protein n=1 Tax=Paenibacillus sp. GP183 TaxID=1882751 RepID=UPI00089C6F0B|nr:sugar phosphate isomerase/epimerase family protein [Paenibacillus sp. GP183]SEC77721.1 Sugar phosphate isomerase/epimerase [Paenibacillus sp. GP183]